MRKFIKIIFFLILIFNIISTAYTVNATPAFQGTPANETPTGGTSTSDDITSTFTGNSDVTGVSDGVSTIQTLIGGVLDAVRVVAVGMAIIVITYLGIKYMYAAPNEKAGIKNNLIIFTIGAIVVFAAASIIDIIKTASQNAIGS